MRRKKPHCGHHSPPAEDLRVVTIAETTPCFCWRKTTTPLTLGLRGMGITSRKRGKCRKWFVYQNRINCSYPLSTLSQAFT